MGEIQINSAIFPKVIQIAFGKPHPKGTETYLTEFDDKPEIILDLPRSAYIIYLQSMAAEGETSELQLLKKYAANKAFTDSEIEEAIRFILHTGQRNNGKVHNNSLLAPFGLCLVTENSKRKVGIINDEKARLRAETWEYILLDMLHNSAFDIISCFDFSGYFVRTEANSRNSEELSYSLSPWKFSGDEAEQSLSNALRSAFMFTLVGYCYGDNKDNYSSFQKFFDEEFFKRVSLVFGIWSNRGTKSKISYIPLYDSFHNLTGENKDDLIKILRAILDDTSLALDEKQALKDRLIEGAGTIHDSATSADIALEQTLVKPVVNFVLLREKAKDTLEAIRLLCASGQYSDCANRCYYAMLYSLKALLEYKGQLASWKPNELKEAETHALLEQKLSALVAQNVLSNQDKIDFEYVKDQRWKCDYSLYRFCRNDAISCLQKAESFYATVERLTT